MDVMVQTLTPAKAQELLAREDIDIVDVREPGEWSPDACLAPGWFRSQLFGAILAEPFEMTVSFSCARQVSAAKRQRDSPSPTGIGECTIFPAERVPGSKRGCRSSRTRPSLALRRECGYLIETSNAVRRRQQGCGQ